MKTLKAPYSTIACSIFLSVVAFAPSSPSLAQSGTTTLTGLSTPNTSPRRSKRQRDRLVDSANSQAWRGRAGRNTLTFDLGQSQTLSEVVISLRSRLSYRSASLLAGSTAKQLQNVSTLPKGVSDGNKQIAFTGLSTNAQVVRVVLRTKGGKGRKRRKATPRVSEVSFSVQANPSASPSSSPGASASPTASSSPTPTPSPLAVTQLETASVNTSGTQSNQVTRRPSISDDGRYVAFIGRISDFDSSSSSNSNGVFLRDRVAGTTSRVSNGNEFARDPFVSGNGRYVAFVSGSGGQVYRYDRVLDSLTLVSQSTGGASSSGVCMDPVMSDDGNFVVFSCFDTNLVSGDSNGFLDLFLRDITQGTTEIISVDSNGVIGNADSLNPSVSNDGNIVVFDSRSDNLTSSDTNATADVFARDRSQGTTFLVSESLSGIQGNDESDTPNISGDGTIVVFQTFALNLVSGPAGMRAVVAKNLSTGEVTYVSQKSDGTQPNGDNYFPVTSNDGRYVAWESDAPDLISGDVNGFMDVFLRDLLTGQTLLVSQTTGAVQGDGNSSDDMGAIKSLASDTLEVAFETVAENLLPGDANSARDIAVVQVSR